uniref:Uncharacterized protein n=1 Tax=Ditylenchus dipsaci TaxID=166011 RepID=A0A915E9Q7_9BILA
MDSIKKSHSIAYVLSCIWLTLLLLPNSSSSIVVSCAMLDDGDDLLSSLDPELSSTVFTDAPIKLSSTSSTSAISSTAVSSMTSTIISSSPSPESGAPNSQATTNSSTTSGSNGDPFDYTVLYVVGALLLVLGILIGIVVCYQYVSCNSGAPDVQAPVAGMLLLPIPCYLSLMYDIRATINQQNANYLLMSMYNNK